MFEADPLSALELEKRPEERVVRFRWIEGAWVEDVATLKVAEDSFAQGSMRRCFHAKKMSSRATVRHAASNSKHAQWKYQRNYVLKTYKPEKARGGGERLRAMLETDVSIRARHACHLASESTEHLCVERSTRGEASLSSKRRAQSSPRDSGASSTRRASSSRGGPPR